MSQAKNPSADPNGGEFRAMSVPDRGSRAEGAGISRSDAFQPLFSRLSAQSTGDCDGNVDSEEAILAQAREKGWTEGMTSGRQEACRLAREALAPAMTSFLTAWHELVQSNERSEAHAADTIVTLAFAIVHRILGEDVRLSERELAPLKAILVQKMSSANQLILCMNPDDLSHLQALSKSDRMSWPDHSAVIIQPDASLAPGSVEVTGSNGKDKRALMDKSIVADVMALLAEQDLLPA